MKILVVGGGVVGRAVARTYMEQHDVAVHDKLPERCTTTLPLHELLESCDLCFVCLPTPLREVGGLDCSALDEFFLYVQGSRKNFVLRSTVPVGTTARLSYEHKLPNLVYSPEFLTSRCSVADAMLPARNIVGVPALNECEGVLERLYVARFPGVQCLCMPSREAEAVKLCTNALFAMTVAMWNELHDFCVRLDMDWTAIRCGILADGRISRAHSQVPGPDGMFGFGGACLPKDLRGFVEQQHALGLRSYMAAGALVRNQQDRGKPCTGS